MSEDEQMEAEEVGGTIMEEGENEQSEPQQQEVYLPGQPLEEGEQLVMDKSAYVLYHQAQTSAPCLSFDIIQDSLGNNRETFPLTAYICCGTQAAQAHVNNVIVIKLSNLHKSNPNAKDDDEDDDSDEEEDDEEDEEKVPKMAGALIKHQGCVNRIRNTVIDGKHLTASWSELGRVHLWDLTEQLRAVDDPTILSQYQKDNRQNAINPLFSFTGHSKEGFALDWCTTQSGVLASGDCHKDIHIWKPQQASWVVDQRPLVGHEQSVEDLQWSPVEANVLASCSVDRTIKIWDTRAPPSKACMLTAQAHESDVNVISWNKLEPFIVSGGDDGRVHVWDLRKFAQNSPLATFKHHSGPVTSVEWHPTDSAVFASAGADNQVALWDLSVEKDSEANCSEDDVQGLPPQLLFIHQGQTNIKEVHWHAQLPGVLISTAESGFNIFRTISV